MAEWRMEGMDAFLNLNFETIKRTDRVIGRSIYPGARYLANAVKNSLEALPVEDKRTRRRRTSINSIQKDALVKSFGVAKLKKNKWGYNVKLGFDGYNSIVTKKYPKGQPNAMIARSLNSGTSFLQKNPFMDTTVEANREETVRIIGETFDKELEKIWGRK